MSDNKRKRRREELLVESESRYDFSQNLHLSGTISFNAEKLLAASEQLPKNTLDYYSILEEVRSALKNVKLEQELWKKWSASSSESDDLVDTFTVKLVSAMFYTELARLNEKKNPDNAWALIYMAALETGVVESLSESIYHNIKKTKQSNTNRKNAIKASDKLIPIKEEAARLLFEMKPEGGWVSVSSAAKKLEKPMQDFISEARIPRVTTQNISELLRKSWIPRDSIVNSAWMKTKEQT